MNLADYQIQVQNICEGLSEADSVHAEQYAKHAQTYQGKVRELQQEAAELRRRLLHSRWWFFMKHMNISYRNMD